MIRLSAVKKAAAVGGTVAVLVAGMSVEAAQASSVDPSIEGAADSSNCVLDLDTTNFACAATTSDALALIGATSDRDATQTPSNAIGEFFEDDNYGGDVLTITSSAGCTSTYSDKEYTVADLTKYGWNDKISSVLTYRHCDARLYEHTHGGGEYSGWIDWNRDLEDFEEGWGDRASSIRFS